MLLLLSQMTKIIFAICIYYITLSSFLVYIIILARRFCFIDRRLRRRRRFVGWASGRLRDMPKYA